MLWFFRSTVLRILLLLLPLIATVTSAAAPDPAAWQTSQLDSVRAAQAALARQGGLSEAQRKEATDLLATALADEELADQQVDARRLLRAQAQRSADDLAPLEQRLGEDDSVALRAWRATLPQRATVEQLESLLEAARTALVDARNAVAAQQGELSALFDRPGALRDELKDAQGALDLMPASAASAPNTPAVLAQAQRLRQAAALRRAQTRVASLEEELGSYEARLRYASARLRERQHDAALQQQKVERLQSLVLDRTSAAVGELNARLQREAAALEQSPRLLGDAAAANVALGEELARAVTRLSEVRTCAMTTAVRAAIPNRHCRTPTIVSRWAALPRRPSA